MRGFMRAIGLGGLFKNSPRNAAGKTSSFHRSNGPAMCTLVPVDDIQLMMPDASTRFERGWSNSSSRKSSIEERPQFLFFCGSDNSGVPAARRTGYANTNTPSTGKDGFSFENADVQARASIKSPTRIQAPAISHRIPVFFTPQPVAMNSFE